MLYTIFAFILILTIFYLLLSKRAFFKLEFIRPRTIYLAFIIKFLSGCVMVWIYTYIHTDRSTADIYKFMDDAAVLHEIRKEQPIVFWQLLSGWYKQDTQFENYLYKTGNWYTNDVNWLKYAQIKDYNLFNSNRFITRVNALLWFVTQGNIYLHVLFFSFFGFVGLVAYYKTFASRLTEKVPRQLMFLALFLLPSILLWTSAPLKDTLVVSFTGIFFLLFTSSQIWLPTRVAGGIICFILLLLLKYYVALALFFYVLIYGISQTKWVKHLHFVFLLLILAAIGVLVNQGMAQIGLMPDIFEFMAEKRMESLKNAAYSDARSYLFYLPAEGLQGLFAAMIFAPANALFLPLFPAKSFSVLLWIQILENWLILASTIWLAIHTNKNMISTPAFKAWFTYVLVLAFIIGFTSPLAGNILRYKSAFMPAMLGLFFVGTHEQNLWNLKMSWLASKL